MEISETIHLLGDILGQVLVEQESRALFEVEERIREAALKRRSDDPLAAAEGGRLLATEIAALETPTARGIAGAFALYFDLVNTAEDNSRIEALRQEALRGSEALRDPTQSLRDSGVLRKSPAPIHDSIAEAIAQLRAGGVTKEQMADLLARLQIELVLTAHPTESRRRTILSKIERITETLRLMSLPECLPEELVQMRKELHEEITTLWLTDRTRTAQPTPTDEVKTSLYFVGQVFWTALPEIYRRLDAALEQDFPGLRAGHSWLRLASWIGGDRDGNPNVTVEAALK
ncbi:MAG: phosphoenolpyruvate carboxylase, partial [Chloroflexi bacterium]|nr:phosphoenolpyruvate carboxylase [Chloroflexota bacterium]